MLRDEEWGCSALSPQERHTAGMAPLLAADLRATRLHTVAIRLAWVVSLAVLLVAEVAAGDVVPVVPWVGRLWLAAVLLLTSIWALPRWTLACASVLGWLLPYGGASWLWGWRAWAIASALALAWLVVPRRTQSTVSRGRPAGERPFERSYANIGAVTGGVALAATAVAVAVLSIIEVVWGTPESMLLGLIAFVLLLGLSAWPRAQHRHAARLRLMAEGGPAREALLTEVDGDHFVGAVDDDRARLRIVALDGVVDREDAGIIQLAHDDDGALINLDDLDDEDAAKVRRAMADLRRWTALCEAVHGPALEVGERVVLIGEPRDGATVAIMRQDGATWLGELRETMKKTRN
ncbi:hypothetical protein GCM10022275_06030 [Tessaracoccus defluvii]